MVYWRATTWWSDPIIQSSDENRGDAERERIGGWGKGEKREERERKRRGRWSGKEHDRD